MSTQGLGPIKGADPVAPETERHTTRFGAVWIWTVLFAANGLVTYSYLTMAGRAMPVAMPAVMAPPGVVRFGGAVVDDPLAVAFPLLVLTGILCSIGSWVYLFQFFSHGVIPFVILGRPLPEDEWWRRGIASSLSWAYLLLMLAALARLAPEMFLFLRPLLFRT